MDILLTLDYEMFNGRSSGTVQNCLITPTIKLLKVLDKYSFKATFFVDTCFLNRLKDETKIHPELMHEYVLIINQLKLLSSKGHDLQLHLHPNWYNAKYEKGVWTSIMEDYKLSDMPKEVIDKMFRDGINLLNSIAGRSVVAFRAGAYCLQTYKEFYRTFSKYGIKIDSSVNRYHKMITEKYQWYDYTEIPEKYSYKFTDDITVENENGQFIEVSIPSYKQSMLSYYYHRLLVKDNIGISKHKWGDGSGTSGSELESFTTKVVNRLKSHLSTHWQRPSIDSDAARYLKDLHKLAKKKNGNYFLIMGHPKNFTPYSLYYLDKFLESLSDKDRNIIESSFACEL